MRAEALANKHATPLVDTELPDELNRLLVRRGACLHHDGRMPLRGPLSGTGPPPYPAVDALALKRAPEAVLDPVVAADPTERLLLTAELGALTPDLRERLDARGTRRRALRATDRLELIRWLYDVEVAPAGQAPVTVAETGLAWFRPQPLVADAITLVAGEDRWDFSLAYALRRARTLAFWVPDSAFSGPAERGAALRLLARLAVRASGPAIVTSATDTDAALQLAGDLQSAALSREAVIRTVEWPEALPARPNRLLVSDRVGRPQPLYLEDGETPSLSTPIPGLSSHAEQMRWMTEVKVRDWSAIRHPALAELLLAPSSSTDARVTSDGIAYSGPNWAVIGGLPLDHQTVRPRFRPSPLLDQLQATAGANGWTCELSEKGQFALATTELLGGFPALCKALRDADFGALLSAYLDADPAAPGLALTDRRRYLSLDDLRALQRSQPAEDLLDELTSRRVLRGGIVLKCERCRHTDWYRPRDTDPLFACLRCSLEQTPTRGARLGDAESSSRYRLDEVVFQFVRHRGDLPALAAFERFAQSERVVQFVSEIELIDQADQRREVDFAVADGADLWLGEAFTAARYVQGQQAQMTRLRRLRAAADTLDAHGVILATAADEIAEATRQHAETVFQGSQLQLELRARTWQIPRPHRMLDEPPGT